MSELIKTHGGCTYGVHTRRKADDLLLDSLLGQKNRMPREGLNAAMTAVFKQGAGEAAFYIGLWSGAHIPDGEETAANLLTLVTEVTTYAQSSRLLLQLGSVADGGASNAANLARFDMQGTGTVNGAFLITSQAKGATSGKLYSLVRFDNPRTFDASLYLELLVGAQFVSLSL